MTRSLSCCAHVARTDAPPIRGILDVVLDDERVPGTAGLRFRGLANVTLCERQARQDAANAVGSNDPPGFKSPILRREARSAYPGAVGQYCSLLVHFPRLGVAQRPD